MDWASHTDGVSRTVVEGGPTALVVATLVSLVLALLSAVTQRRGLRLLQLAATLVTAGAAIAVALSRISGPRTSSEEWVAPSRPTNPVPPSG